MIQACVEIKRKYELSEIGSSEFSKIVFAEASPSEFRSPSDAFSFEEMRILWNLKQVGQRDLDWIWNSMIAQIEEV